MQVRDCGVVSLPKASIGDWLMFARARIVPISSQRPQGSFRREGGRALGIAERRFAAEDVVIVLGKPVCFIAHVLEQAECKRVAAEPQRLILLG